MKVFYTSKSHGSHGNLANIHIIKNALILNIMHNISNFPETEFAICIILVLVPIESG